MRAGQIIDFGIEFFKRQAQLTKQRIKEDALKGIFQNGTSNSRLSKQYAKYKANRMERFTKRTGNVGTKLKSYQGVSIKSTESRFSNMYLTGQTLDSITPVKIDGYGFTLSFNPRDTKKIEGNEKYGRVVAWISEKNQDLILDEINKMLDSNIEKYTKEDINITIS